MLDATQTSRPASPTAAAATSNERVWSLKVVDDTYADREAAYLDNAVREESSEPDDWEVGRNSNPVISHLRLLKYMSERDATLAAGVSQGSGNALQHRALFVAANLAERNR
jgi:hypothetical protein